MHWLKNVNYKSGKQRHFNVSSVHSETFSSWSSPQSQAELDKLTCYYYNRHLLLVIKPVKIELASLNPYLLFNLHTLYEFRFFGWLIFAT